MFSWDATGAMASITPPLLVLSGTADIVTKPEAGSEIAISNPGGTYRAIDGVNHMGFLEQSAIYNAAIADFALRSFAAARDERPAVVKQQ